MSANEVKRPRPKPNYPCPACHSTDWWWPSDSYWGPKQWVCGQCHPNPNPVSKEAEVSNNSSDELITELSTNMTAHRPYYLADDTIVPSVTTVLSILDKPGLPHWAWECGRQGLDYREVRDAAARVGTIAHYLIACHLKGEVPDTSVYYSETEVEKAKRCLAKYLCWEKQCPIAPVMVETPLVSEEFKYGGTLDLLAELDGEFVLIDFKTGGGLYESMFYQLAAYWRLLAEQGWPVTSARILRISPDDDDFEVAIRIDLDRDWQIFQHCLVIYRLQSEMPRPQRRSPWKRGIACGEL